MDIRHARKGLNIFYYGKGKGKTSAVMGLAARAAGAGMNVHILQFVKAKKPGPGDKLHGGEWPVSSEIVFFDAVREFFRNDVAGPGAAHKIGTITTGQSGLGFVGILGDKKEKEAHIAEAEAGIAEAKRIITADIYDVIILDELVSALEVGLLAEEDVLALITDKPKHLHLAYTGHDAYPKIIGESDVVSEIKMVKHPYYEGIMAQRGIDF